MKRNITLILVILLSQVHQGQTKWTKDDRNNLYSDCMSIISSYNATSKEQKESVCLCYIDEISKKHSKDEYQAKIEIEIKRIREATLELCTKHTGIELTNKTESSTINNNSEINATKETITGHWKDENSEFWLFESGDYKMQYLDGKTAKGTWKTDNAQLDLYKDKLFGTSEKHYKILIFTHDKFVYQSLKNKAETFTAIRIK